MKWGDTPLPEDEDQAEGIPSPAYLAEFGCDPVILSCVDPVTSYVSRDNSDASS
jgi:hypothetical protein